MMAEYTGINADELRGLLSQYDLGNLVGHKRLAGGAANSSFVITTDAGEYILSVCDEKNKQEIECLTAWLVQLGAQHYPSPRLMTTRDGQRMLAHRGNPVYVKGFIRGDVSRFLNEAMLDQVGQELARLHAIEPHASLPICHPYGLEYFDDVVQGPNRDPFVRWLSDRQDFLLENTSAELPRGFCHGDVFCDNLLFAKGNLVAVLDFEEACHFTKAFDLGMTIIGCCVRRHAIARKLVKALVTGYQKERVLEQREREALSVYIEYAAAATAFWRFRQYHIRRPDVKRAEAHLEMQALADQVHEMSREEFLQAVTS